MNRLARLILKLRMVLAWSSLFIASAAAAQGTLLGTNCAAPPLWHCPDTACESAVVTQPGNNVEPLTRRTFFLDCPSDYQPGDKVNILLSLHGGGCDTRLPYPRMDSR